MKRKENGKWTIGMMLTIFGLSFLLLTGCGNEDDDNNENDDDDTADDDDATDDDDDTADDDDTTDDDDDTTDDDDSADAGAATDVEAYVKDGTNRIKFSDMSVTTSDTDDWDIAVGFIQPQHPGIFLNIGVGAVNMGNDKGFHEIDEAPESGYKEDTAEKMVIGEDFWTEKDETAHTFVMSENVYVIKTANGDYAKIEVLSAGGGTIIVRCYFQKDGSRNIKTTEN